MTNFYSISFLIDKGKLYYLVNMCRECFEAKDENAWKIVEKMVSPDMSNETVNEEERNIYKNYLRGSMLYSDDEFVKLDGDEEETTENLCLHYVASYFYQFRKYFKDEEYLTLITDKKKAEKVELVRKIYQACPEALTMKNKKELEVLEGSGDDKKPGDPKELVENQSPKEIIPADIIDEWDIFAPIPSPDAALRDSNSKGFRDIPSFKWRVLCTDNDLNEWHIKNIKFYRSFDGLDGTQFESDTYDWIHSSSPNGNNIAFPDEIIERGEIITKGIWLGIHLHQPEVVRSIRLTNGTAYSTSSLKVQSYNELTDEWVTVWNLEDLSTDSTEQLLNHVKGMFVL